MDEQRFQAYVALIEQLLICGDGEEVTILQQQAELVDAGLLAIMQQYADWLEQQGNSNAEWLRQFTQRLATVLEDTNTQTEGSSEEADQFLLAVLQLVFESQGNAQQVYPFLTQHQERLNPAILQILPKVAAALLASNPEQRNFAAVALFAFGNLIQQFPQGQRWLNLELSIVAYQQVLNVATQKDMPVEWVTTMVNLASAYKDRIRGDRTENIEQAINYYQQALTVTVNKDMPVEWAAIMMNLALAHFSRIRGDRAENIEQAINYYQQALTVLTQRDMPIEWALTIMNLASAYYSRIRGDRAENIEQAINCYQQALTVRTQGDMPVKWALTTMNLASAYKDRIRGDRAENIEQAINYYQQALTVRTQRDMPVEWALTISNLALAHFSRIRGDRAENIEQAINYYQQALTVLTQRDMPIDWAMTISNLASAYPERIRGDRAENLEQAINYYQQALMVRTQRNAPVDWALTISNLASAYRNRIRGDRAENIEQAINYYQQALTVLTQRDMPVEWARSIGNLALAYRNRIQGDRAENLEQAINYYQQALMVRTQRNTPVDWALTIGHLALAYLDRIRGDRAENIEQAINHCQQALTVTTRIDMPVEWARNIGNLALAYYFRIRGDRAENIEQAVESYQSSLEIYTPELFPNDCRRIARYLGDLYVEKNRWAEATPIYQKALQAAEILYRNANLLDSQAAELAETADLPRRAAYALARNGNLPTAALTLEQGRARGLSESLERDQSNLIRLQQTNSKLFSQYQDITAQLRNLESQQRSRMTSEEHHSLTPEDFRTEAMQLRQMLTEIIEQIRQVEGYTDFLAQPDFSDIQRAVHPHVPLVYLVPNYAGSLALIVTHYRIVDLWLNDLTETKLIDLLGNTWFKAYDQSQTSYPAWLEAIDQVTHQLWQPLMAPLIDHLKQQSFQQAILIPTGYLSLLPLHAAWTEDTTTTTGKRYALDEIHFTYAPNARSINAAADIAQRTGADSILAINNPRRDLPNSSREVNAAVASFPQYKVLKHEEATISSVLAALPHHTILHLSCHGTANLREPLTSGLAMSDGLLTLRDILDLKLSEQGSIRLAVLSACETGLTGIEIADEAIGLPTGLLQAGVAGVVASLWSVSDLSTMMLLVRFYDLWRKGEINPSEALRQAQVWVRDTTNKQKYDYFKSKLSDPPNSQDQSGITEAFLNEFMLNYIYPSGWEARDFAHPFHWAAFSYVGV